MTFQRDQRQIFSIRKFKAYGAASVLLGLLTLGVNGQTQANTLSSATVTIEESVLTKEPEVLPLPKTPGETSPSVSPVETLTQEEPEGDGVSKLHSLSQTLDKSVLSKRLEGLKKRELSQENEAFRVQFDEVLTKAQEVLTKSEVTVEELTKLLADLDQLEALLGREQSDKDKKENTENAQLSDVRDLPKESMLTQALAVSEHLGTESGADVLEQAAAVSVLQAALEKVGHPALDLQELNDLLTFVQKELHKPLSREVIQGMALALDDFRKQSQAQAADQVVRETTPATSSRSRRQRRALDDQDWATAEEKAQIQSEKADRQRTLDDYFRNEYGRYLRKVDHQYVLEGDDIQPIRLSETDAFIINTKKYPDGLDRGEPIGVNAKDARTPELLNRINAKLNLMGLSAAYMSGSKTIEISGKINRADKVTGERLQWFVQILHGNNASATEFLKHTGSIQKSSGIPASNSTGVSIHLFDVYSTNKKDYLDNFAKDRDKIINEIQQASPYYNNWQVSNWTQRLNRLKGHLPGYRTSFPTALHQKLGINTKAYDVEIPETTKAKDINDVTPVPKTMYVEDLGQLRVEELVSVSRKPEAANYRPTDGIYNKESATFASTEPKREVGVQNIDVKVVFGDKSEIIVSVPLTLNSSEYEFFIKTVDEELEKYKGMIENKDQKRPLTQESRQHIENELEKIAQEIREEIEKLKPKRHNQIRPYFYREVGRMYLVLYKERALIEIDMEKERLTEVINGNDDLTSEDQRVLLADVEKQARLYKEVVAEKGVIRDPLPGEGSSRHHAAGNRIEHAIYELKNLGIIEHKATRVAENKKIAREEIAAKAKEITDFLKDDTTLSPEDKERLTNNLNTVKQEVEQAFERRTIEHILTGAFGNIQPEFKRIKDEEIAKLQLLLDEAKKFAVAKKNAKDAIDAEVNRVKQKITNNNNLTETDKERLKEEATQAGETAKAEIDKKVTTDEVTNDKEDQVRKVTAVGTTAQDLGEAKKQAKAMIEEALNKVKEVITNNDNLTPADQQRLEAEATQVAKDAKAAIDAKADKDGVTDSQAAQVATVTAVGDKATALGNAKVDAKAELDRQAETAKQAITATPHLTAEDQDRLKAEVTKAVDDAKAAIDTQASPETVTQAKDAGIQAIDAVQAKSGELGQVKADAKAEVTAKLADVIQAIADNGDLTQDDKDRLTQEANQAADRAKAELDAKETTAEVTDAKQAQVDTVTAVGTTAQELGEAKKQAKDAIENALNDVKQAIGQNTDLTPEDQQRLQAEATQAAKDAKATIDAKVAKAGVTDSQAAQVATVTAVGDKATVLGNAKADAKAEVTAKLADVIQAIADNGNLTQDDKDRLTQEANQAADRAKAELDAKETTAEVTDAKQAQVDTVTAVETKADELGNAKKAAKAAIEEALNKVKEVITNNDNLTPADQQRLQAEATQAAKDAKATIDAKVAKAGVTDSQAAQVATVTAVGDKATVLGNAKADAKAEVTAKLADVIQAIADNGNLTQDDKDRLTQEANQAADRAKAELDAKETTAEVTDVKPTQVDTVTAVGTTAQELGEAKKQAKDAIENALNDVKQAIGQNTDLTPEDQQRLQAEATQAAKDAKATIDAKVAKAGVTDSQAAQVATVTAVGDKATVLGNAKADAKAEVTAKLADVIQAIADNGDLTQDDKDRLTQEANQAADRAKAELDAKETTAEVTDAKQAQVDTVTAVETKADELGNEKKAAKDAIEDELNRVNQEITNNNNLTETDKERLKEEATQAGETAKAEIDKKATTDEVTGAKQAQVDTVTAVETKADELGNEKKAAKDAIEDELNRVNQEITNNNNLTETDKERLKEEATQAGETAKAEIDKKVTTDEVTNDKENQVRKVTEVGTTAQELGNAKKAAKAAIDAEVNRVKEAIKNNDNLTPADQQRLEAEATQAAKDAKAAIDAKVAKDGVTDTQAAQVATVTAVGDKATALGNAKADAKAEIDRQAETAKQAITANPHLTAEDQNRLTAEVTKAVDAAKAAVDTHETPETVTQAKETGTQGIDAVEGRAATLGNMKADTKYVLDTKKRTAEINRDNNFANSRLIPLAKRLPNTGDNQSSSIMMELLLLLAGIIVFKKRKKED